MASPTPIAYLFHGDDEPSQKDAVDKFIASLNIDEFNISRLEGKSTRAMDIESAAASLPFLADVRLVHVDNITEHPDIKTFLDELTTLLPGLPDWARILFVETNLKDQNYDSQGERKRKGSRRQAIKKLIKAIEQDSRGVVRTFSMPNNPAVWIRQRATHYETQIDEDAVRVLADRIGEDLVLADTELTKLSTYAGDRPISAGDVELLTPFTAEASIFSLVDAIGLRDGRTALVLLDHLIEEQNEQPLYILVMIARQYRLLIQVREYLDAGGTPNNAGAALGIHAYVAKKMASQARHYRIDQLERIYRYLSEMDLDIKTGKIDAKLALQTFITRLSR